MLYIQFSILHRLWKNVEITKTLPKLWKTGESQIHKTRTLVARQGENGGMRIGADMVVAELLVKALHDAIRRVVVLAEVAEHDVFQAGMIYLGYETGHFLIAQMSEGA